MRLIISGGGTGGHVYPALAVVPELKRLCVETEILWLGSSNGMEQALVERAGLTFAAISAVGLRGKNPLNALKSLGVLTHGYRQSRAWFRRFHPAVTFVTGGYVCAPVTLAAWQAGSPIVIYLPDIEPGLAIKFLAYFANRVAVTVPETQEFFKPGLTVVTGYPVRAELFAQTAEARLGKTPGVEQNKVKAAARRKLGLRDDLPVLMVFGGSRGARSINQALMNDIEILLHVSQVTHVTGVLDIDWIQARRAELPSRLQARYQVSAYLHDDMVTALLAADLVISRAGASVLGEFPAAGLPAILVPYPHAGAHQVLNANYLARRGAARVIKEAELNQKLKETVFDLLTNPEALQNMGQAARNLAQPEAATRLAQEIFAVGKKGVRD